MDSLVKKDTLVSLLTGFLVDLGSYRDVGDVTCFKKAFKVRGVVATGDEN